MDEEDTGIQEGMTELADLLAKNGFNVSHACVAEGDDPAHLFVEVNKGQDFMAECNRLRDLLESVGVECTTDDEDFAAPHLRGNYNIKSELGRIALTNVDDLKLAGN